MSIYTRKGDGGETGMPGGERVAKDSAIVEAYGAIDEANSAIGFARVAVSDADLDGFLAFAQHRLASAAAALAPARTGAGAPPASVWTDDTAYLERAVGTFMARSAPFSGFVLVGGSEAGARLHLARAAVRRAERRLVTLHAERPFEPALLAFVNRLSDALYAAARAANAIDGAVLEPWDPCTPPPELP
jgi:cob(I)alamin adenosyltransferase